MKGRFAARQGCSLRPSRREEVVSGRRPERSEEVLPGVPKRSIKTLLNHVMPGVYQPARRNVNWSSDLRRNAQRSVYGNPRRGASPTRRDPARCPWRLGGEPRLHADIEKAQPVWGRAERTDGREDEGEEEPELHLFKLAIEATKPPPGWSEDSRNGVGKSGRICARAAWEKRGSTAVHCR